jgi:hypothetical protein
MVAPVRTTNAGVHLWRLGSSAGAMAFSSVLITLFPEYTAGYSLLVAMATAGFFAFIVSLGLAAEKSNLLDILNYLEQNEVVQVVASLMVASVTLIVASLLAITLVRIWNRPVPVHVLISIPLGVLVLLRCSFSWIGFAVGGAEAVQQWRRTVQAR